MLKVIVIFFALIIGAIVYTQQSLQSGAVLRYIDHHAQDKGIPAATYYIGQGYYLLQNLPDATTYFLRVAQRYPNHPALADDGYFYYLQCRDDSVVVPRTELAEGYKAYLERYPNGRHVDLAKTKLDNYATGGR